MKQSRGNSKISEVKRHIVQGVAYSLLALAVCGSAAALFFVSEGKRIAEEHTTIVTGPDVIPSENEQFPVSVNPERKEITEHPLVEVYFNAHIAERSDNAPIQTSWLHRAVGRLALMSWYQNLASLSTRMLVVLSGERKEEIAQHFGAILGWDESEKKDFLAQITKSAPALEEGKFFPGMYTVAKEATPAEVAPLIMDRFTEEVISRYGDDVESIVPLHDALTIASLLEREAYDFEDMRMISGVIWNRLFVGMPLQIDATLQYAKGSNPYEPWWPRVYPGDKYIASAYNTYKHEGLPPAPIANPSLDAILAALNPRKTDCMYYFHDRNAEFHCSKTYKEHVDLLTQYYGRGK